ncbi:MAG: VanZ family protein [Clostridia bacterium]|nr:VanZ family protein [Clostridia bacterium]
MKRKVIRYSFLALSIAIMVIIFCLSAQNGDKSSELSGAWANAVRELFNAIDMPSAAEFVIGYIRKFAHVFIYACLGVSVSIFIFTFQFRRKWLWIVIPLAVCFIYACSDEFHQLFVSGREGKFTDVLIDSIGFVTTILLSWLVWLFIYRR